MQKFFDLAKSRLDSFQQQQHGGSDNTPPIPTSSKPHRQHGNSARVVWPPRVECIDVLGEIRDTNGRNIPRDFGRSISLGGQHFYMFGDTFCFDDHREFVGLTSNTCAHIGDKNTPTKSSYWTSDPLVPEFIPFTPEDHEYNKRKKKEGTQCRVANWAFGGVIEHPPGSGHGWLLNDKTLIQDGGSVGIELVRVELQQGFPIKIKAEKIPGAFPFRENEPRFGCIDIFIDGGWVYLLGGHQDEGGWPRNVLARIKYGDDLTQRSNYQFHCQNGGWQTTYPRGDDLTDVCPGQGHGKMFKVGENGPKGKPYMWIGVDKWMSNKLHLGVAPAPEGPWEIQDVGEVPKILGDKSKTRYCLYVHEWGSDFSQGELLISWSDDGQMGGLVVAGKLKLATEEDSRRDEL